MVNYLEALWLLFVFLSIEMQIVSPHPSNPSRGAHLHASQSGVCLQSCTNLATPFHEQTWVSSQACRPHGLRTPLTVQLLVKCLGFRCFYFEHSGQQRSVVSWKPVRLALVGPPLTLSGDKIC